MVGQGYLTVTFIAKYYELTQRYPELPRLTDLQREATAVFGALVNSDLLRLDLNLSPGDIQLVYNHNLVHTRSGFTDYDVRQPLCSSRPIVTSTCLRTVEGVHLRVSLSRECVHPLCMRPV